MIIDEELTKIHPDGVWLVDLAKLMYTLNMPTSTFRIQPNQWMHAGGTFIIIWYEVLHVF